jgi:type IV pilus assembly protein PilB
MATLEHSTPVDPKPDAKGVPASPAIDPAAAGRVPGGDGADETRIGRILVEEGLVTPDQLSKAQRIQTRLESRKSLAILVVELGWVSRPRLEAALHRHRGELSVEAILIEKGLITADQLAAAQEAVLSQPGKAAGRHLVELGAVTERAYLEAYCEKHNLPFVEADAGIVDPQVLKKVSLRYLAKQRVLPLSIQEGRLNVVAEDLGRPEVLAELERLYGCPVTVSIAEPARIAEALKTLASDGEPDRHAGAGGTIQYHRLAEATENAKAAGEIVDHLLMRAIQDGASDIHIEPMQSKVRVRFRVDGSLVHVTDYPASYAASVISRVKVLARADIAEHRIHQDGRIFLQTAGEEIDLRASFYVTVFGENAVLRVLRKTKALVGLEEMGCSPATLKILVEDVLDPSTGIVLVTGPTGSGKTTTLYAAVERLCDDSKKIITCEDPVEYVIDGITQCSVASRPGITFVDSLKAIVRQDPDVILIGEIRDRESASMAIQAALTGHKVLSTFHTEDSIGALVRLGEMDIEPFLITSTVTAVLAQRLVRKQCPHCRADYAPTAAEIRALSLPREELAGFGLTKGRGCQRCFYTGYRGRVGVYELLVLHDELREAILQRKSAHELRRLAFETPGFFCLQEDGIAKAIRGETTLCEVAENCPRSKAVRPLGRLLEMYQ